MSSSAVPTVNSEASTTRRPAFDLRQVEDVVDELQQVAPAAQDVGHVFVLPLVQITVGLILFEQLGESNDGIERRPKLMAHVGEELRLGAVGGLGCLAGLLVGRGAPALGDISVHRDHP